MTATLSREVEGHENNTRTFYLRQVYGVPGLRTPAEQSRWECALRVEMLAAKVHAPPPHVAEAGSVYR